MFRKFFNFVDSRYTKFWHTGVVIIIYIFIFILLVSLSKIK